MQRADVVADYHYCTFCGAGLRPERAYRPDETAGWFHSRDCYEFSLVYPDLRRRLARGTGGAEMTTATRPGFEED